MCEWYATRVLISPKFLLTLPHGKFSPSWHLRSKLIPKGLWYFPKWVFVYRQSIYCHFPHSRGGNEIALTTKTHYTLIRNVMLFTNLNLLLRFLFLAYFSILRFICLPVCVCMFVCLYACVSVYVGKYEKSVLLYDNKGIKNSRFWFGFYFAASSNTKQKISNGIYRLRRMNYASTRKMGNERKIIPGHTRFRRCLLWRGENLLLLLCVRLFFRIQHVRFGGR